jgi:predicted polyphosphate/ATP-dependent NAD kinase
MSAKAEKKSPSNFVKGVPVKTVGFIVNPIAGMGGAVGLKGTDGKAVLERAIVLGAKPIAPARAESFLSEFKLAERRIRLIVGAGRMGEDEARNCGFAFTVLGDGKKETSAEDTIEIAKRITDADADLLVFCGGDGTARDVLDAVGMKLPVLGVPTGVKMHSAVFAVDPKAAARISTEFLWEELPLREAEVMDVDEEAFREGRLSARLYGYMLIPYEPTLIQGAKMASPMTENEVRNQAAIAIYIIENMEPNVIYILGPGTTTRTITDLLDQEKTLLGVDLLCNKKLIAKDVNEKQILREIKGKTAKIIVTPIGGQGFIFGRGNQQISPAVIRRVGINNIVVVATKNKLRDLKSLRIDTGDPKLDEALRGHIKVIADYREEHMMRVE